MQKNEITDEQRRILRCWWMFELFSPQSLPKQKIPTNKKRKAQDADFEEQVIELRPQQKLPWETLPTPPPKSGKNRMWRHNVYLGVYSLEATYELLHRIFHDDADSYDARRPGESACAAFVVDHTGRSVPGTAILSSALWGVGRLCDPGPNDPSWSEGFEEATANFSISFDAEAAELCVDGEEKHVPEHDDAPVLTRAMLLKLCELAQHAAGVEGDVNLSTDRILIESRVVQEDDEHQAAGKTADLDFLNSFFFADLNRVRRSGVASSSALAQYLTSEEALPRDQRIDVIAQPDVVMKGTTAERIPLGRWPANPEHGLALSQQFAVNKVLGDLADTRGIMGVNGPPGTGKTTMLRDILAGNVVKRACKLAELDDPDNAFLSTEYRVKLDRFTHVFHSLCPSLTGYEMVVASSNNSAVQNVSTEIPGLSAIDKQWQDEHDYFADLASKVLSAALKEGAGKDSNAKAWGLVAATLGNKKKRTAFHSMFWFGEKPTQRQKKQQPDPVPGMLERLKQWRDGEKIPKPWEEARRDFFQAKKHVEVLIEERTQAQHRLQEAEQLSAQVHSCEAECQHRQEEFQRAHDQAEVSQLESHKLEEERAYASVQYERQMALKPGFLEVLFSLGKASRAWREELRPYAAELSNIENKLWEATQNQQHCEAEERRLHDVLAVSRERLEEIRSEYSVLAMQCSEDKEKYGSSYPDADWIGDQRELHAPWLDAELDQARSELFFAALELHQDFLALTAKKMLRGLNVAMDVIAGKAKNVESEKVLAAWQLFFLVVPMVSTTFASVERMLGNLGPESLGWLFIDEAGQASPQHAAGAIWRARRVVAVGDPLQLQPVVTIPKKAQSDIAATYGVSQTWIPPKASVQTLADRVSLYGTTLTQGDEDVWVSSPLRVHRRCDDPMFTLCNQIAYNNIMVNGVHRGSADLDKFAVTDEPDIKVSCWIHESAQQAGSHVQDNQIEQVVRGIDYLQQHGIQAKDIIAIAPFRDVANKLSQLSNKYKGLKAGTIHTAQGREAAVVFLVLSADPEKDGAKAWAAESVNLVNVAASRAKRRLYVIGDKDAWAQHNYFRELAEILDPEHHNLSTTQ